MIISGGIHDLTKFGIFYCKQRERENCLTHYFYNNIKRLKRSTYCMYVYILKLEGNLINENVQINVFFCLIQENCQWTPKVIFF